jgi:GDPmannose 4,6-dehydratase
VNAAAAELGLTLAWEGAGAKETGKIAGVDRDRFGAALQGDAYAPRLGQTIVRVDERYFRPTEVDTLLGDSAKAAEKLGWKPSRSFAEMVTEMTREDLNLARRDNVCRDAGFKTFAHEE